MVITCLKQPQHKHLQAQVHLCWLLALEWDRSPSLGALMALQVLPLSSLEVTPCLKYTARSSQPMAHT